MRLLDNTIYHNKFYDYVINIEVPGTFRQCRGNAGATRLAYTDLWKHVAVPDAFCALFSDPQVVAALF